MMILIQFKCGIWILLKLGPKEGGGPSKELRDKSWFKFTFFAQNNITKKKITTSVSGKDPGYDDTSKMLSESAICLVKDILSQDEIIYGCQTTSSCFGSKLINRLNNRGIKFEVIN
jgi:short subunit dehydrogenase-like uncharacterized protein